ncbi:MAG: DUF4214 domain-containing protein [Pseudomonadota bacterium]
MKDIFSNARKNFAHSIPCLLLFLVASCGGGGGGSEATDAPAPRILATAAVSSSADYSTLVQQLYIAYLGRPADSAGLADFQVRLAALGAPANIQDLEQAYDTNPGIKALIDGFAESAESTALYPGTNAKFVNAVYHNLFNRDPLIAGLNFWTSQMTSGSVTKGKAVLSIMAAAFKNQSEQSRIDEATLNKKVVVANNFKNALADIRSESYKGSDATWMLRYLLSSVWGGTDTAKFQSRIASDLNNFAIDASYIPFDTLTGQWGAVAYGDSIFGESLMNEPAQLAVMVSSNLLMIKAQISSAATCTYSARLNDEHTSIDAGAYQCSDSSKGTWKLLDMHRIGTDDTYIALIKDGGTVQRFYGMSKIKPGIPAEVLSPLISETAGDYYAVYFWRTPFPGTRERPGKPFNHQPVSVVAFTQTDNIAIKVNGINLTIVAQSLLGGSCTYIATIRSDGRRLLGESFTCAGNQTIRTWKLVDLHVTPSKAVQLSLLVNGEPYQIYGLKAP